MIEVTIPAQQQAADQHVRQRNKVKPMRALPVPKPLAAAPMTGAKVPTLGQMIARAQLVPVRLARNVTVSPTRLKLALWTIWAQDEAWLTIDDMADCMGCSVSSAYAAIKALTQMGMISETGRRGPYTGGGRTFIISKEKLLSFYGTRVIKRKRGHALTEARKKQLARALQIRWDRERKAKAAAAKAAAQP